MSLAKRFFLFLLPIILTAGCGQPVKKEARFLMGTYVEVTSPDPRAFGIVFSEFERLEKIFSLFDEDSELSLFNKSGSRQVSEDLFRVLSEAVRYHRLTGGLFDVTIAPLSLVWKRALKEGALPPAEAVARARSLVGGDQLYLDETTRTARLMRYGASVDLGGIAKGYAVDRAVALLKEAGISTALVNVGGNMFGLSAAGARPWIVGIQDPRRQKKTVGVATLLNQAISTSGDYEQYFIFQNRRYSHIIDPKTGQPVASGLAAVTIVAPDATSADALSTSCFLAGRQRCVDFCKATEGVRATMIADDGSVWYFPESNDQKR